MSAAWAIMDSEGRLLPGITGESRMEVARKVLPMRYDPFRLKVSASYREMFERDLSKVLAQNGWRIVRMKTRHRRDVAPNTFVPTAAAA